MPDPYESKPESDAAALSAAISSFKPYKDSASAQSKLNHQSQIKYSWLNRVPFGHKNEYLVRPPLPSVVQM